MMRRLFLVGGICGLLVAAATMAWAAINLNGSKSNVYSTFGRSFFVSATESLTGPSETVTVYTTPETGNFILTQLCVGPANGGIRLAANGFGPIAHTSFQDYCQIFSPGFVVPPNSAMTCSTTAAAEAGDHFCTISGMWSR